MLPDSPLALVPIVSVPREARSGAEYLMSVDLRHELPSEAWPWEQEEIQLTCLIETLPLFSHQSLGEPSIIVHRFGGSYAPAQFLLKATQGDASGSIGVLFVDGRGVAVHRLRVDGVRIRTSADQEGPTMTPRGIRRRSRSISGSFKKIRRTRARF
jgi:hypothetical protein